MSYVNRLESIARFVREHGHRTEHVNGCVRFTCSDGKVHDVSTMTQARIALGY